MRRRLAIAGRLLAAARSRAPRRASQTSPSFRLAFVVSALLLALLWPDLSQAGQLTPQERRGKQIYLRGESPSGGQILARIGDASTEVPAAALPCANCHGLGGRGKPEAGIVPSDITRQTLTKPYGVTQVDGRTHLAYTAPLLERAIAKGLDASGNALGPVMPRYRMSGEDLADLVAYLNRLGSEQDPGLTRTGIVLGTVLPGRGPLLEIGRAMRGAMTAYFDEINARGGIYDRRIRLRVIEAADTPAGTRAAVLRVIAREPVFAMVGAVMAGAEEELPALAEREGLPLVGPFTLPPPDGSPLNRYVFYLLAGVKDQARALVDFAAGRRPGAPPRVAILSPAEETQRGLAESVEEQCRKHQWSGVRKAEFPRGGFDAARTAQEAARGGAETVFFLGSGREAVALMQAAERIGWAPDLYLLGLLAGQEIFDAPAPFRDKLFLAYPTLPSDQTSAGLEEYRRLAAAHRLSPMHLAAQLSALAAARVLVEGLKRAGRDVSRDSLITTLEGFYRFQTGLTPPVTFGPNQRIGALGAYVVPIDLGQRGFGAASQWISLE